MPHLSTPSIRHIYLLHLSASSICPSICPSIYPICHGRTDGLSVPLICLSCLPHLSAPSITDGRTSCLPHISVPSVCPIYLTYLSAPSVTDRRKDGRDYRIRLSAASVCPIYLLHLPIYLAHLSQTDGRTDGWTNGLSCPSIYPSICHNYLPICMPHMS